MNIMTNTLGGASSDFVLISWSLQRGESGYVLFIKQLDFLKIFVIYLKNFLEWYEGTEKTCIVVLQSMFLIHIKREAQT